MGRKIAVLLGLMVALGLAACQAPGGGAALAPLETVVATPVAETRSNRPILLNTPVSSAASSSPVAVGTAPPASTPTAGEVAAPSPASQAVAAATVAAATPAASPAATVAAPIALSSPTPSRAASTSATSTTSSAAVTSGLTPASVKAEGSEELKELTVRLDDRVDNLRQALREKDIDTSMRLQRELIGILDQADGTIQGEKSELGDKMRRVSQLLRQGLGGDLARIDDAATILRQLTGRTTTNRVITDVYRYAGDLAGKVGALKKARQSGDISAVFRVQSELVGEVRRAQADLTPGRTKLTDTVLAALADLQAGLEGNLERLDAAEATLNDVAKIPSQKAAAPTAAGAAATPGPGR